MNPNAPFCMGRKNLQLSAWAAGEKTFRMSCRYVYQRMLDEQRPADLLQLPPSFHDDLAVFLGERPAHASLLWPLLLQVGHSIDITCTFY